MLPDLNIIIAALIGFIIGFLVEFGLEVWYFRRLRRSQEDGEDVEAELQARDERIEQLEATLQARNQRIDDLQGRLEGAQIRMNALQGEIAQQVQAKEGGRIVEPVPERRPAIVPEKQTGDDQASSES